MKTEENVFSRAEIREREQALREDTTRAAMN